MPEEDDSHRYHQLVFLWFTDHEKFGRYVELVAPTVKLYGGRLDRQIAPESFVGEGLEQPDVVNLVSSPSRERFDAFHADEGFQRIVHLRSESTRMASVQGTFIRGEPGRSDPKARLYLVELALFGAHGEAAYRAYEAEAEPVMARYGYHVERELRPVQATGFPFSPDVVKVAFLDEPGAMDRMHGDPMHERLEKELYPGATKQSIWIVGRSRAP
jgi:uncharacterized protein (DUF1330 family)